MKQNMNVKVEVKVFPNDNQNQNAYVPPADQESQNGYNYKESMFHNYKDTPERAKFTYLAISLGICLSLILCALSLILITNSNNSIKALIVLGFFFSFILLPWNICHKMFFNRVEIFLSNMRKKILMN